MSDLIEQFDGLIDESEDAAKRLRRARSELAATAAKPKRKTRSDKGKRRRKPQRAVEAEREPEPTTPEHDHARELAETPGVSEGEAIAQALGLGKED
jgi:hypothetical protein